MYRYLHLFIYVYIMYKINVHGMFLKCGRHREIYTRCLGVLLFKRSFVIARGRRIKREGGV